MAELLWSGYGGGGYGTFLRGAVRAEHDRACLCSSVLLMAAAIKAIAS